MRIFVYILTINLAIFGFTNSQSIPENEMRAVWVATVSNLDWPALNENSSQQMQSFTNMIDSLKSININTIFFQVRTECDAFYKSDYEPWSRYLTGIQGNDPGYDPLQFALETCHARGMEVHVWLNPYRINVSATDGGNYYSDKNIYKKHPEWAINYSSGKKILNPGLPQVQKYIKTIVGDILNKYDVDGIHFDDYFYSYDGTPQSLDISSYQTYGTQYSTIGDFRRASINKMVKEVFDTIQAIKPYVRFGISPFGIYGNNMNPSGISGFDAYNGIYCDPLAWLNDGTVDYIVPQLYWQTGGSQDFGKLLPWWADKVMLKNRHVFAGHGIYRLADNPPASYFDFDDIINSYIDISGLSFLEKTLLADWTLEEIIRQINIVRQNSEKGSLGSVYFRAKDFERVKNLKKYIFENSYNKKSLLPEIKWRSGQIPAKPEYLHLIDENNKLKVAWNYNGSNTRYAVYIVSDTNQVLGSQNLYDVSYVNNIELTAKNYYGQVFVCIKPYNRFWKNGEKSNFIKIDKPSAPELIAPANNESLRISDFLVWKPVEHSSLYHIEISTDVFFINIIGSFETPETSYSIENLNISGEKKYFWRVRASNIAGISDYSEIRSFIASFPLTPEIIFPQDNDTSVSTEPELKFSYSNSTEQLQIQISKSKYSFEIYNVLDTIINAVNQVKIKNKLSISSDYYIRVRAKNSYGFSNWSDVNKFTTYIPLPDQTSFLYPENNTIYSEETEKVQFGWRVAQKADEYVFQLSNYANFDQIYREEIISSSTNTYFYNPEPQIWYYARIAGKNDGGLGPWSPVIRIILHNNYVKTNEEYEDSFITIYPNPSNEIISIQSDMFFDSKEIKFEFYNYQGIKLLEENRKINKNSGFFQFDIKQIKCNVCYLRITNENVSKTVNFIKF